MSASAVALPIEREPGLPDLGVLVRINERPAFMFLRDDLSSTDETHIVAELERRASGGTLALEEW